MGTIDLKLIGILCSFEKKRVEQHVEICSNAAILSPALKCKLLRITILDFKVDK
jgi:hypothetical protein